MTRSNHLRFVPGPHNALPGSYAGVLSVFEDLRAIHKNVSNADRVLVWIFESRTVGNCLWIEDDDISKHSPLEKPTMVEAKIGCRQASQSPHGFGE